MHPRSGAPLEADEPRANQASVQDLVRRIKDYRGKYEAGTFALVGPWGSGKSSLAIAASAELKSGHGWKIATFEPWAYSDYPTMLYGFFHTLRKQLGEKKLNRKTEGTLQKFFQSVAPFENISGVIGIPLSGIFSGLAKVSAKREDFLSMRDEANKVFEQNGQPSLIIIEDIDRLHSAELMNCFKLIRLLGDLSNVYYLLCYDERTVMDVMKTSEVIGSGNSQRAREYLEKIVQIRVDVLELYGTEQEELWRAELDALTMSNQIELSANEEWALGLIWKDVLSIYLRTPRALKRFALQLSSTWQAISGEVDFPDFVAINFLRTFEIELFHKLKRMRFELLSPTDGFGKEAVNVRINEWNKLLGELHVKDPDAVLKLLSSMFPSINGYGSSMDYLTYNRPRRISRDLYFDRYFRNLLAFEEIPEQYYRAYIDDVNRGEYCELSERVRHSLNMREEHVWGRLEEEITDKDIASGELFDDIRAQYAWMMSVGGVVADVDSDLLRLAFRTIKDDGRRFSDINWYAELSEKVGGMALATDIFLDRWELDYSNANNSFTKLNQNLMELAERQILAELAKDPNDADHSVFRGLNILMRNLGTSEIKNILRKFIGGSSLWSVPDLLTSFLKVSIKHAPTGPIYATGHGQLEYEIVERLLGFEWVKERINPETAESVPFLKWSQERPAQSAVRELVVSEIHLIFKEVEAKERLLRKQGNQDDK